MKVTTIIWLLVTIKSHISAENNEGRTDFYCNGTRFYPATFCNGYYECESYGFLFWTFGWTPVLKTCPNEHSFNFTSESCLPSFCKAPMVCDGPGKYPVVPTKMARNNDSGNNYYECEATWFFFVPLDWKLKLKTCPNEQIYEPSINDCVRATNISSTSAPSVTVTVTTNITATATTTQSPNSTVSYLSVTTTITNITATATTTHTPNSTTVSSPLSNPTTTSVLNTTTASTYFPPTLTSIFHISSTKSPVPPPFTTTDGKETPSDESTATSVTPTESTSTAFKTNINVVLLLFSSLYLLVDNNAI